MKLFKGVKNMDVLISDAKAQGWEVDRQKFDTEMSDWIFLRDMMERFKQIAVNVTNGYFFVYEPISEKPTATHTSSEFDEELWYQEILELIYEPVVEVAIMNKYKLVDGVELNGKHPKTFQIPSEHDKANFRVDDFIKLGFIELGKPTERMWVKITERNGDSFTGTLDNVPVQLQTVKYEDVVQFEAKHIIAAREGV